RAVVLCFFQTAADPLSQRALAALLRHRARFDDLDCCFFGVSVDPEDERLGRVQKSLPGVRYFWDTDRQVRRLSGADAANGAAAPAPGYRRYTLVLDERLRVFTALAALPPPAAEAPAAVQAPVLVVPRVFEPKLCQSADRLLRPARRRGVRVHARGGRADGRR